MHPLKAKNEYRPGKTGKYSFNLRGRIHDRLYTILLSRAKLGILRGISKCFVLHIAMWCYRSPTPPEDR